MIKLCVICKNQLDKMMYQSKCRPCFKIEKEEEILGLKAEIKSIKKKIEAIREVIDAEYIDWHAKDGPSSFQTIDKKAVILNDARVRVRVGTVIL